MKINWYVVGGIILAAIAIVILIYLFREELFGKTADAKNNGGSGSGTGIVTNPIFPLRNGSFNLTEVGKLQTYLKNRGGTNCDGSTLSVDNDFGPNTECATKQILNVVEVSESLYKSLGL